MKARVVVVEITMEADLARLQDELAAVRGREFAVLHVRELTSWIRRFDIGAERGTRRDDVARSLRIVGYRKLYTVAFVVDDAKVRFLRLFHGGRDWEAEFLLS